MTDLFKHIYLISRLHHLKYTAAYIGTSDRMLTFNKLQFGNLARHTWGTKLTFLGQIQLGHSWGTIRSHLGHPA